MNFQELLTKIKQIDEGTVAECGDMPTIESDMEECGGMMPMSSPKQSDSVTMNVSMNGSGAGGIKDLLSILKDIESGAPQHGPRGDDEIVVGEPKGFDVEIDDSYDNSPNTTTLNIDAVTPTGNDLFSKGDEAEKANGGGNPWNQTEVSESLVNKLAAHYASVKTR